MKQMMMAVLAAVSLLLAASAANANGYATGDVNLRDGPGKSYPRIATIPAGEPVFIHGCIDNGWWCEVSYGRWHGWSSGKYLRQAEAPPNLTSPEWSGRAWYGADWAAPRYVIRGYVPQGYVGQGYVGQGYVAGWPGTAYAVPVQRYRVLVPYGYAPGWW